MVDVCASGDEDLVWTGDFETLECSVFGVEAYGVVEPDVYDAVVRIGQTDERAGGDDVFAVDEVAGDE